MKTYQELVREIKRMKASPKFKESHREIETSYSAGLVNGYHTALSDLLNFLKK